MALHRSWAGVEYGRMRITECDTPFIMYDSHMSRDEHAVVIHAGGEELGPDVDGKIDITDLQRKLGVLERIQDNTGGSYETPKLDPVKRENQRRREAGILLKKPLHDDDDEDTDD